MRTAVKHDMTHLFPCVVTVDQIDRVMIPHLHPTGAKLLRDGGEVIVQKGEIGEIIPTKMSAEDHRGRDIGLGHFFGSFLDTVMIVPIGPVEIVPADPPGGDALSLGDRFWRICDWIHFLPPSVVIFLYPSIYSMIPTSMTVSPFVFQYDDLSKQSYGTFIITVFCTFDNM